MFIAIKKAEWSIIQIRFISFTHVASALGGKTTGGTVKIPSGGMNSIDWLIDLLLLSISILRNDLF